MIWPDKSYAIDPGSTVASVTLPSSGDADGIASYGSTDEYGNAAGTSVSTGVLSYGWQGSAQREVANAGLMLMGARVYNPTDGRFTTVDPVIGGNENSFNYPDDPINQSDLSGKRKTARSLATQLKSNAIKVSHGIKRSHWRFSISHDAIGTIVVMAGLISSYMGVAWAADAILTAINTVAGVTVGLIIALVLAVTMALVATLVYLDWANHDRGVVIG